MVFAATSEFCTPVPSPSLKSANAYMEEGQTPSKFVYLFLMCVYHYSITRREYSVVVFAATRESCSPSPYPCWKGANAYIEREQTPRAFVYVFNICSYQYNITSREGSILVFAAMNESCTSVPSPCLKSANACGKGAHTEPFRTIV